MDGKSQGQQAPPGTGQESVVEQGYGRRLIAPPRRVEPSKRTAYAFYPIAVGIAAAVTVIF